MSEALLFIKPTLTEWKEHLSSPNYGKIWDLPFLSQLLLRFCIRSIASVLCCWKCALYFWSTLCLCCMSSETGKYKCLYKLIFGKQWEVFLSSCLSLTLSRHQTIVQMVLRLGSKRTTFPSAAFVFVLYMGFSKVACPLLFSWTEHPVYCALSVFLGGKKKKMRLHISYETVSQLSTLLPMQ